MTKIPLKIIPDDFLTSDRTGTDALLNQFNRDRPCGECQACCEVQAVHELGKPFHTKCAHQCKAGCDIYSSRPESCHDYVCAWKMGQGSMEDRPDKLGVLTGLNGDSLTDEGAWIDVYETRKGAVLTLDDGSMNVFGLKQVDHMVKEMEAFLSDPIAPIPVLGVRLFAYGIPIPADFEPLPPYTGLSSKLVRIMAPIASNRKNDKQRLMVYIGPGTEEMELVEW